MAKSRINRNKRLEFKCLKETILMKGITRTNKFEASMIRFIIFSIQICLLNKQHVIPKLSAPWRLH